MAPLGTISRGLERGRQLDQTGVLAGTGRTKAGCGPLGSSFLEKPGLLVNLAFVSGGYRGIQTLNTQNIPNHYPLL
jgi:hypothetical protein